MEVKLMRDTKIYHVVSALFKLDNCFYNLEGGREVTDEMIEIFFNTKEEADGWLVGAIFCGCGNTAWFHNNRTYYYCDDCLPPEMLKKLGKREW